MPRGQPRLSFRELTIRSREAAELRATGLSYRKIAFKMQVPRMTVWRWVQWHQDMTACWGFVPRNRARRLPFRSGLGWDQERFDRLVADRAKVVEAMKAQEALDREQQVRTDAAAVTRAAEKSRQDEGKEWLDAGADPSKVPEWLRKQLARDSSART